MGYIAYMNSVIKNKNGISGRILTVFFAGLVCFVSVGCKKDLPTIDSNALLPEVIQDTLEGKVKPGETYASLIRNLDLHPTHVQNVLSALQTHFPVKLYAGQLYRVVFQRQGKGEPELYNFTLEARNGLLRHTLEGSSQQALNYKAAEVSIVTDTVAVHGSLSNNLYDAFVQLGEHPAILDRVTQVFAWDIDFFRDPRRGDSFSVLIEKKWRDDGVFLGYGNVLSARYVNQGHAYVGIRYGDGLYDSAGQSLQKILMKAPLKFSRISSGFTNSRLHPVLGIRRPHWGVDYAAPMNTPIFSAGDGVVTSAGWAGGYGKCVTIRHNGVYATLYRHLNGFAAGVKTGKRVKQGEVIGYLGMTGLATGPHLDYRVQMNGRFINPTSLATEAKAGIPKSEWELFVKRRDHLIARMDQPAAQHYASVAIPTASASPNSTL